MCSLCCLCTSPVTPISNWPSVRPTAAPRFESRRCDLCQSRGEDKPDSPTISKWQIGLGQRHKPFLGGTARAPLGGMIMPPKGVQGRSPGTPLVPFVVKRKEPRVWAGQAHWWVQGLPVPQNLPGAWGGAPKRWVAGTMSLHNPPGDRSAPLLQKSRI